MMGQQTEKHSDVVIVTGVSASGKDFLLDRTLAGIGPTERSIRSVAFGQEILRLMRQESTECESRDGLRDVPADVVRHFAHRVIASLVQSEGTKVLNTHVTYRQGDLVVSDPATDLEIKARDYIFVSADPAEIAKRRRTDTSRARREESEDMIAIHQEIARATVTALAYRIGSGLTVIENTVEGTDENVAQMQEVIAQKAS